MKPDFLRPKDEVNFVFFSAPWDDIYHTRKQKLPLWLSHRGHKVLYINPLASMLEPIRSSTRRQWLFQWIYGLRKKNDNLFILSLPLMIPGARRIKFVAYLNSLMGASIVRHYLKKMNFDEKELIVWLYLPTMYPLVRFIPYNFMVYDCIDDHAAYPSAIKFHNLIETLEQKILRKADIVFTVSKDLEREKRKYNKKTFYVSNGVDFDTYKQTSTEENRGVLEVPKNNPPTILYVGAIAEWFDIEIIRSAAERHPNWLIILVGIVSINLTVLDKYKNVVRTGTKSPNEVANYLRESDVCIIPFKVNSLTIKCNPLKLYEYFAAGKPVVTSPISEAIRFQRNNLLKIAEGAEEFTKFIEMFLKSDSIQTKRHRRRIAYKHSWNKLFSKMGKIIEENL